MNVQLFGQLAHHWRGDRFGTLRGDTTRLTTIMGTHRYLTIGGHLEGLVIREAENVYPHESK